MTFADLRTALQARGFDHVGSSVLDIAINYAYQVDICEGEEWPFLLTSTTGTAPLTIADLRTVKAVTVPTLRIKLDPLDDRHITDDWDTDLTTVGTPEFYYFTGQTTLTTYPVTTDTLAVAYWLVPETLEDADSPVFPARFHSIIVDAAVRRAYESADEWIKAENARVVFEGEDGYGGRMNDMRESLLGQQNDQPSQYVVPRPYATYR